jgi:hypothetical protein
MPFPSSPTNGQTYVLNNTSYTYNSALGTWTATQAGVSTPITIAANTAATSATTGALQVVGGIGVQGNIYTASTVVMGSPFTMRNKIINGAMAIDQRNAGASVTPGNDTAVLDRWKFNMSAASKYSVQQVTDAPTGFGYSLKMTSSSAYTVGVSEVFATMQPIEGFNFYDLCFGTASAKTITVSFWVKSSLTGTFGGSITNYAQNRFYPFTYSIVSANTWEQKSVTISGDTTGTWVGASNAGAAYLWFSIGSGSSVSQTAGSWTASSGYSATGSVSVVGTNAATWQITGVQLETGTAATPFEHRNFQQELAMCQRYYCKANRIIFSNPSPGSSNTYVLGNYPFPVNMRAQPTVTFERPNNATTGQIDIWGGTAVDVSSADIDGTKGISGAILTLATTTSSLIFGKFYANAEL